MITVRMHVDGLGNGWAIVQCVSCWDVNKYPALDAYDAPVVCKRCGQSSMARDALMAWRVDHPVPTSLRTRPSETVSA